MAKEGMMSRNKLFGIMYQLRLKSGFSLQIMIRRLIDLALAETHPGKERILNVRFDPRDGGAYTYVWGEKKDKFMIVLGGGLIVETASRSGLGIPEAIKKEGIEVTVRSIFPTFRTMLMGTAFHEVGHYLYTDMRDTSISAYKEPKYRPFIHNMFNILEDPVVEHNMIELFKRPAFGKVKNPKVYFDQLIEAMFDPNKYSDDGSVQSLLNYILLCVRCGRSKIRNHCAIFDKYSSDLVPMMKAVLMEPHPTERIHKTITLCEWMIENIKELDFSTATIDDKDIRSGKGVDDEPIPSIGGSGGSKSGHVEDLDDPRDHPEDPKDPKDPEEPKAPKDDPEDKPDDEIPPEYIDEIKDVFNDNMVLSAEHEFRFAKDECSADSKMLSVKIDEKIEEFRDVSSTIGKFFKSFKDKIRMRTVSGQKTGTLNIRRAMNNEIKHGCDLRLFNKNKTGGDDIDLAVCLVTDNSGSMSGTKSYICSDACLAFAQACDWSNIPFEVIAFTKSCDSSSGLSQSIVIKKLEDKFEDSKPFFAINDSKLIGYLDIPSDLYAFRGNSEEVNIYHIWKERFRKVEHKQKLMIVMCDGCTTGSVDDLKNVLKLVQDDGITVIGIGIECSAVGDIYQNNKVFSSEEQLRNELAPYMVSILSSYLAKAKHRR